MVQLVLTTYKWGANAITKRYDKTHNVLSVQGKGKYRN